MERRKRKRKGGMTLWLPATMRREKGSGLSGQGAGSRSTRTKRHRKIATKLEKAEKRKVKMPKSEKKRVVAGKK